MTARFTTGKSRRMLLGLSITAATLILALIASSRIFMSNQTRQTSQISPSVTNMQIPVTISTLHMLDMQNGWALTDKGQVVKTTDGGSHWKNVSPPSPFTTNPVGTVLHQQWREIVTNPPLHKFPPLDFIAYTTGWAIGSTQDNNPSLLKTIDGGHTWTVLTTVMI